MKIAEAIITGARLPGIYRLNSRANPSALLGDIAKAGWRTFYIDGHQVFDKASFLKTFADTLAFPNYFGNNWDAFEECIRDLAPAPGYVLLYDQVSQFAVKEPDDWEIALDILAATVSFWNKTDSPLYIFLRNAGDFAPQVQVW